MAKKQKLEMKSYKLLGDFPTSKKEYKKGQMIRLTKKGAAYLRTLNKIK